MKRMIKGLASIALALVGLTLYSCDRSDEVPTAPPSNERYKVTAIIDDGEGNVYKLDDSSVLLRAAGETRKGDAMFLGLRGYFHGESCHLAVKAAPGSNKKIDYVLFKYTPGANSYKADRFPTTKYEYDNWYITNSKIYKPANGYDHTFDFNVIGDITIVAYMKKAEPGIDVGIE